MWKLVPKFMKISDKKQIMNNLNYFLELLKSEDEDIRIEAWRLVIKFNGNITERGGYKKVFKVLARTFAQ
jgi:hypothetical protein